MMAGRKAFKRWADTKEGATIPRTLRNLVGDATNFIHEQFHKLSFRFKLYVFIIYIGHKKAKNMGYKHAVSLCY